MSDDEPNLTDDDLTTAPPAQWSAALRDQLLTAAERRAESPRQRCREHARPL